jgi:hypothetical protein
VSTEQPNIYKYGLRTPRRTGSEGEADAPSAAEELDKEVKQNGTNTNVMTPVNVEPEQVEHVNHVNQPLPAAVSPRVQWSVVLAPLWYPVWITWLCCYTLFSVLTYWDTVLLVHLNQFYRYTLGARDRARDYQPTQLGRTLLLALLAAALLWTLLQRPGHARSSVEQGTVHDLHEFEALSEELEHVKSSTRDVLARLESVPSATRVQLLEDHVRGLDKSVEQLSKHVTGLKSSTTTTSGSEASVSSASEELLRDMSVSISTLQNNLANTAHSLEDKVTILTERLAGLSLSFDALTERVNQQTEALRAQLLADQQLQSLIDQRIQIKLDADPRLNRPEAVPSITQQQVHALVEDEIERELAAFMNDRVQALVDATLRDLRSEVQQQFQAESRATVARESELSGALVERLTQLINERVTRVERSSSSSSGEGADRAWIEEQIRRALHRHIEGDVTARTDYALLSADAHIYKPLTHYTPLPLPESRAGSWSWITSVFGSTPRVRTPHGPRVAIHRSGPRSVGECWGFGGAHANLTVKLSQPITVSHVTIDHLSRDIAYNIESAPREFQIWAVNVTHADPEHSPRTLLGSFEYDVDGEPVQTFALPNTALATQHVMLSVLSNHGHYYTCLYRFRVHGAPTLKELRTVN